MANQTLRQTTNGARARARHSAAQLGHRLGVFVNAAFRPMAPASEPHMSGAGCERCPARVQLALCTVGSNARAWAGELSGAALTDPCTGVYRATVDTLGGPRTVAYTASSSRAYIRRWLGHWAGIYSGRTVTAQAPTTGPLSGGQS